MVSWAAGVTSYLLLVLSVVAFPRPEKKQETWQEWSWDEFDPTAIGSHSVLSMLDFSFKDLPLIEANDTCDGCCLGNETHEVSPDPRQTALEPWKSDEASPLFHLQDKKQEKNSKNCRGKCVEKTRFTDLWKNSNKTAFGTLGNKNITEQLTVGGNTTADRCLHCCNVTETVQDNPQITQHTDLKTKPRRKRTDSEEYESVLLGKAGILLRSSTKEKLLYNCKEGRCRGNKS
ncbi:uncharacterized protein LOC128660069 isoform X2 [Bombina bombina]|uniref:uncharacterized protein LOC128660069 isoform X2 n=1 Tax=Bombina bombina TaxID=8345 RepID=UPI00235A71AD|nr:uncharacterized protein LOC128660069 isoform X2 [Bombina bombina]